MSIAERLNKYLEDHNMSIMAFAKLCGVNYYTIYALHTGMTQRPSARVAAKIAKILNVSVADLRENQPTQTEYKRVKKQKAAVEVVDDQSTIIRVVIPHIMSVIQNVETNNKIQKEKMKLWVTPSLKAKFAHSAGKPTYAKMAIASIPVVLMPGDGDRWVLSVASEKLYFGG